MVLTNETYFPNGFIIRNSRNPLLIGSMVLTLAIETSPRVSITGRRNPLLIGSMVLTELENGNINCVNCSRNPLLIGSMVLTQDLE